MTNDMHAKAWSAYRSGRDEEAVALCEQCVSSGDINCMSLMGWIYYDGRAKPTNPEVSMRWFSLAAESGNREGYYGKGLVFHHLYNDVAKAFEQIKIAADMGHVLAKVRLGIMLQQGVGASIDIEQAFCLFDEAANDGNLRAELLKTILMLKGYGGLFSRVRAVPLFFIVIFRVALVTFRDRFDKRLRY